MAAVTLPVKQGSILVKPGVYHNPNSVLSTLLPQWCVQEADVDVFTLDAVTQHKMLAMGALGDLREHRFLHNWDTYFTQEFINTVISPHILSLTVEVYL